MSKIIYILIIIINFQTYSQDSKEDLIDSQSIIEKYIKSIGGKDKISKIKTLRKKSTISIDGISQFEMEGEVIYKTPNLYSSQVTVSEIGIIQSTKYDGNTCTIRRYKNNKETISKVEGKSLKQKMKDFYPFPILNINNKNIKCQTKKISYNRESLYQMYVDDSSSNDSLFLFFDTNNYLLVKKVESSLKSKKTTTYLDYKDFNGVKIPTVEITSIEIDKKNAQKSENKVIDIIINEELQLNDFQ